MLLTFVLLVCSYSPIFAPVAPSCASDCIYGFTNPKYPSFPLPGTLQGDITLNTNNPIKFTNGSNIASGKTCNSDTFSALTSAGWVTSYTDANGQTSSFSSMFYATQLNVKIRTIQTKQANLESFLIGNPLKLALTCNNGVIGCIYFTVGGASSNSPPGALACNYGD